MKFFFWLTVLVSTHALAQDKAAYKLFDKQGRPVAFEKMIQVLSKADIVLFGELHDNAIDHWLELQVTRDLYELRNDLVMGMEMFEADDQLVLNEYLEGTIEERHLLEEAKVWSNYKKDYRPLIEFAREKKLPVIATNIPTRYANLVFRKGINSLSGLTAEARQWIAPQPLEIDLDLPGYKNMITMGGHGTEENGVNMAGAQAVRDATMAYFILKNRKGIFLHFNGAYHSQNYEGIQWHLKKNDHEAVVMTIHSVEQDTLEKLDEQHKGAADFIICTPRDMIKTF